MAGVGWEAVPATSEFRRRVSSESRGEGAPLTKPLTQRALAGDLRGVASGTRARAGSGAAAAGAHAAATAGEFPDTLERRVPKTLGTTLGVPPVTDRSVRSGGTCSGPGPQPVETVHIDRGSVWTPTVRGGSSLRRGRLRESIGSQPVVLSFGSSGGASVWMEASHATVSMRDACVAASDVLGARGGGGVVGGGGGGAGGGGGGAGGGAGAAAGGGAGGAESGGGEEGGRGFGGDGGSGGGGSTNVVEKTVRGDDFETGLVMAIGPAYASLPSPPWQRMAMPTTMTHAAIMKSTTFAAPTGAPEVLRVTTLIAMPKAHAPIAIPRRASHGRTASGRESASQSSSARLLEDCISVDQTVRVPTVKLPRSSAHGRTACCLSMGGGGFVGGSTAPPQRRRAATNQGFPRFG